MDISTGQGAEEGGERGGTKAAVKVGYEAGLGKTAAYPSTYCSVLPVHKQYRHFLKLYKIKSIMS